VRVDAVPDHVYHGELVRVVPQADVQKNVLPVKVKITDPDSQLRPDMIAKVQFLKAAPEKKSAATSSKPAQQPGSGIGIAQTRAPLLLPESALQDIHGDSAAVWLAIANGTAVRREVKLGEKRGELREIRDGVQPPDRIIATRTEKLKPGMRVATQEEN
jgi:hypothetical protein